MDIPQRYVWLCLRVGRHIDEFVDAFVGPGDGSDPSLPMSSSIRSASAMKRESCWRGSA